MTYLNVLDDTLVACVSLYAVSCRGERIGHDIKKRPATAVGDGEGSNGDCVLLEPFRSESGGAIAYIAFGPGDTAPLRRQVCC